MATCASQQALRDRLNKLMEQLRQAGLGQPNQNQQGKGERGEKGQGNEMGQLGDAGEAMGQAEGELGEAIAEGAVGSQGRALEAHAQGRQGLASRCSRAGMGPAPKAGPAGPRRAQQETIRSDRPLRGRDYGDDVTVKVRRDRRAARAPHPSKNCASASAKASPAARARLHRASVAGFLSSGKRYLVPPPSRLAR